MLQSMIKSTLKRFGIDIKRLLPADNFDLQIGRIITDGGYDLVFDVGANIGQFASSLRENGFQGTLVSVEPLTKAHQQLTKKAQGDADWHITPRCALGAIAGSTTINISGMHASSSLLPMKGTHEQAAPGSARIGTEQVDISTLDTIYPRYAANARKVFVKIDTQGFELEVLKGAVETLPQIDGMLLELSLVELYDGQPLWTEVIEWLANNGFELVGLNQGFVDPVTFHTLQIDGVFFRQPAG